jgi:3-dehydro-L-gulonate-6-phosphate decarboxylase
MRPLLQLALDYASIPEALATCRRLAAEVDVLEAGTLLIAAEGMRAVRCLRASYPDHLLAADFKVADAGALLAKMSFDAGADWMTVICAAPIATVESALKVARRHPKGDVQIELFGNWTFEDAAEWRRAGITQAIYHRGRDAQAAGQSWSKTDLDKLRRLADMGFETSVTGGLTVEDLPLFRDIPVKVFIAGRSLGEAPDPAAAARAFKSRIAELWS